jgi:hypothetical protein
MFVPRAIDSHTARFRRDEDVHDFAGRKTEHGGHSAPRQLLGECLVHARALA